MKDIIERPFGYKFSRRKIARHVCIDCGINVIKIGDYCMIHADVWEKQLGLRWSDNMCLRCVELRLGRALTAEEVGWGLIHDVEGYPKSDLLMARIYPPVPPKQRRKRKPSKRRKRRAPATSASG